MGGEEAARTRRGGAGPEKIQELAKENKASPNREKKAIDFRQQNLCTSSIPAARGTASHGRGLAVTRSRR